jgi:hypothetical protein
LLTSPQPASYFSDIVNKYDHRSDGVTADGFVDFFASQTPEKILQDLLYVWRPKKE